MTTYNLRKSAELMDYHGGTITVKSQGVIISLGNSEELVEWDDLGNLVDKVTALVSTINYKPEHPEDVEYIEETPLGHVTRVEGDEVFCVACGKRWGVDEEEPECTP